MSLFQAKFLLFPLAVALFLFSCKPESVRGAASSETRTLVDCLGREIVMLAQPPQRVVCIGAGALRLYTYVGELERLCGVEACEQAGSLFSERPYQVVNQELFSALPVIGTGGPAGTADAEALLRAKPDLIFSTFRDDPRAMERLQVETGIPVVVLSYGAKEAFDPEIAVSLRLIGEVMGRQTRAEELVTYIDGLREDLRSRTGALPAEDRPRVYLGCHTRFGTHGFGSSTAQYSLFEAVGARNVLDEAGRRGYQKNVGLEEVLALDPEAVILDAGGLPLFREEYARHRALFQTMRAFRDGHVFVQLPYNAYYTNLETAYADSYLIGKCLFPEEFQDISLEEKAREIYAFLLGKEYPMRLPENPLTLP